MEKMGLQSSSSNSSKKPVRRRCHTRKIAQVSVTNMAEARREIAHALLLHRSSSSSSSPVSNVSQEREPPMLGNSYGYTSTSTNNLASSYSCYSLVEPMPLPVLDPVWSTTAPSVPAAAAPPGLEAMEFLEWAENQAAACTWWLAFLRALDSNNIENAKCPFVDNVMEENSRVLTEQHEISKVWEPRNFRGPIDQTASLDEWLVYPIEEDDDDS